MIDLNPDLNLFPTQVGIELGIFFASYGVLNKVLFQPYLELVRARNAKSTDLKEKSAQQKVQAEKLQTEYDAFMKIQRKEVAHWLDEERALIEEARNKVAKELAASRKAAEEQLDIAKKELLPLVGDYSSKIVAKLTGKKVTISSAGVVAKKEIEETL